MTSSPHSEDLALVRAALAGDPRACEEFAERMRFVPRVLAARNGRSGRPLSQEELKDLAQDVVLLVWRKLDTYSGRAALETWVYRFAYLELFNFLRRRSRRPQLVEELEGTPIEPAASAEVEDDGEEDVGVLLRHLAPREAEVVRLRHVEQLSFAEVGEALDISASSAKTHYYRGLDKLRELLAAKTSQGEDA